MKVQEAIKAIKESMAGKEQEAFKSAAFEIVKVTEEHFAELAQKPAIKEALQHLAESRRAGSFPCVEASCFAENWQYCKRLQYKSKALLKKQLFKQALLCAFRASASCSSFSSYIEAASFAELAGC